MGYSGPYTLGVRCLSEILATGMGIYIGEAGIANALLPGAKGQGMGFGFLGLCYGFAFCFATICFGHISSILNPAFCLAMLITGDLSFPDFLALSASEFVGAFLGAILVWIHWLPHFKTCPEPPSLTPDDALLRRRDALTADGSAISSYGAKGGAEVHGSSTGIAAAVKDIAYYAINVNRHAARRRSSRHTPRPPSSRRESFSHLITTHTNLSRQRQQPQLQQHQLQQQQPGTPTSHLIRVISNPHLSAYHANAVNVGHVDPLHFRKNPMPRSASAVSLLTSIYAANSAADLPSASTVGGTFVPPHILAGTDLEMVSPRTESFKRRVRITDQGTEASNDGFPKSRMGRELQSPQPDPTKLSISRISDDIQYLPPYDSTFEGSANTGSMPPAAPVTAATAGHRLHIADAGMITVQVSEDSTHSMFSPHSYGNLADAASAAAFDAGQEISQSQAHRALLHKEVRRRLGHHSGPRAILQAAVASRQAASVQNAGVHSFGVQDGDTGRQSAGRKQVSVSEHGTAITAPLEGSDATLAPLPQIGHPLRGGLALTRLRRASNSNSSSYNEFSSLLHKPGQQVHFKDKQLSPPEHHLKSKEQGKATLEIQDEQVQAQKHVTRLFEAAVMADQAAKLSIFATRPAIYAPAFNVLCEFLSTILLVTGIMLIGEKATSLPPGPIRDGYAQVVAPIICGLYIFVLILGAGGPTGLACNPARDLGPRIAHWVLPIGNKGPSEFKYYGWVPVVGDLIGGAVAGWIFLAIKTLNRPLV